MRGRRKYMRNSRLKHILIIAVVFVAASAICSSAWSEESASKKKKKYPHPHTLHLEVMSQKAADISADEIKDWSGFFRSLQSKINILPIRVESRMLMSSFRPDALNSDEKAVVINEINKLLLDEKFSSHLKGAVTFSAESIKLESDYGKSKDREDLKWLNRSIMSDMFAQIARKGKVIGLKQMTCATCHEAWGPKAWGQTEKGAVAGTKPMVDERAVMECFSKVIEGGKTMDECAEMVSIIKKSRIEPYGPLKNFIQRSNADGEIPFFVAVHPENPYTFKPLLKKLVCLECHGQERKVTKIKGKDGKMKEITVFYGIGIKKRHEQDHETE